MNDRKEVSPLVQALKWVFEKCYDFFMSRSWKTKIVFLAFSFLIFFWLVTKNIDLLMMPFHKENGSTIDHFVWLTESSRRPVSDCHVIFVSWLVVGAVITILSWKFKKPNVFVQFEFLVLIPFWFNFSWGVGPVFFLILAAHSIMIAAYFRKRYLWITSLLITYFCLSLYFIGITICFEDVSSFF